MHYFIYADADATLYEGSATQSRNTGLDEILEVRKDMNDNASVINVSRALIKFDLTEISSSIVDGLIPSNNKPEPSASYFLNLYDAGSTGLTSTSQLLYAHIVSQSWTAGEGTFHDDPETTEGVSWRYRVGQNDATQWISGSNNTGGTWYSGSALDSATATITISDYTELNAGDKVNLIAADGTNYDFTNGDQSSVNGTWESATSNNQTATNLMNVINTSSGPAGTRFTATAAGAVVTATQATAGTVGNTSVTLTDSGTAGMTKTNFSGGTWSEYGYVASQSFDYGSTDMRMNVTEPITTLLQSSSDYPNNGFIIKRSGSVGNDDSNCPEGDSSEYGQFKFFSRDTNTIYQPKLEVAWKDFSYDNTAMTASSVNVMSGSQLDDVVFYMKGMRDSYKENSKIKFRLVGRERYPTKTYETTPRTLQINAFPSGTLFYSVKDALTEETIIPFDQYTAVSCGGSGHYFNLWLNGLQAERYYKLLYKLVIDSGTANEISDIYDNDFTFKVEK